MKTKHHGSTDQELINAAMAPIRARLQSALARVNSQDHLAQLIGIPRSTITHILAGRCPRMGTLVKIAMYFDLLPSKAEDTADYLTIYDRIYHKLDEIERLVDIVSGGRK